MEEEDERSRAFTPTSRLTRSPPPPKPRDTEPVKTPRAKEGTAKRQLPSPEDSQEARRPRIEEPAADSQGFDISQMEDTRSGSTSGGLTGRAREELQDEANAALEDIMGIVTAESRSNKLNKAEVAKIGTLGRHMLAIITSLSIRLAEQELRACRAEISCTEAKARAQTLEMQVEAGGTSEVAGGPTTARMVTYSDCLRMGKNKERPKPASGPVVAVYPADENSGIKSAEATKAEIKKAVNPAAHGLQVDKLRKVGNAGVVIQTTSQGAADRLRKALPPTLRVTVPQQRKPLVALNNVEGDPAEEGIIAALHEQNFLESEYWTLQQLKKDAKVAFKRSRRGSPKTTIVLECAPALRDALINKGKLYFGWDVIVVSDYLRVTCCHKCQMYGHPEKLCRAESRTCGRCGNGGHGEADCKSETLACGTCKRFNRPADHRTASVDCPARKHAEARYLATVNYG